MEFVCQQCGKCCKEVTINICASDIRRWLHERRTDILQEIIFVTNYPHKNTGGFYIRKTLKTEDKTLHQPCPFLLESGLCDIHDTKPRACADFPHGHKPWRPCPAWNAIDYKIDKRKHERARKSQRKDFKDAHENYQYLIRKITEGRRGNYGV